MIGGWLRLTVGQVDEIALSLRPTTTPQSRPPDILFAADAASGECDEPEFMRYEDTLHPTIAMAELSLAAGNARSVMADQACFPPR